MGSEGNVMKGSRYAAVGLVAVAALWIVSGHLGHTRAARARPPAQRCSSPRSPRKRAQLPRPSVVSARCARDVSGARLPQKPQPLQWRHVYASRPPVNGEREELKRQLSMSWRLLRDRCVAPCVRRRRSSAEDSALAGDTACSTFHHFRLDDDLHDIADYIVQVAMYVDEFFLLGDDFPPPST